MWHVLGDHAVVLVFVGSTLLFVVLKVLADYLMTEPTRRGGHVGLKYHGPSKQLMLQSIHVYNPRLGEGLNCMTMLDFVAAKYKLRVILQCANTKASQALGRAAVRTLGFKLNSNFSTAWSQQFDGPIDPTRCGRVLEGAAYLSREIMGDVDLWVAECVRTCVHHAHENFEAETFGEDEPSGS